MQSNWTKDTAAILAIVAVFSSPASAAAQQPKRAAPDSETVVFVCEHGTAKSVIAMSYFTKLAMERGLKVRAVSRGTAPESAIPAPLRAALGADGFALTDFQPTKFTLGDLAHAIDVISFDQ